MRRPYVSRAAAAGLAFAVTGALAPAQDGGRLPVSATAEVSFRLDRPGLPVPNYLLTVHEDGSGTYQGEEVTDNGKPATVPASGTARRPAEPFHQAVMVSPATARRIFALANSLKDFNTACASKAKNVADTGTKTLTFRGPSGGGSCTYNFSENKNVVQLTDLFYGVSETMDEGRRLEHLHRYDRLGLDAAIGFLAQEVTDGRAVELGSIAGTLRAIAGDADVMQRVRLRASQLLSLLPADLQNSAP